MTTLVLSPRYSNDSIKVWRAAVAAGWKTIRVNHLASASAIVSELGTGADNVVIYGETILADQVAAALDLWLLEPSYDWLPSLPYDLRLRDVRLVTLDEANKMPGPGPRFVKPVDDKWFPAGLYYPEIGIAPWLGGDELVLVSEQVHFGLEVRAFIHHRQIVDLAPYLCNGQRTTDPMSPDSENAAVACLERLLASDVELPPAVVVDVGEIYGRGWGVVEANPIWASGLYDADAASVLPCLRSVCLPGSQVTPQDMRWLRPRAGRSAPTPPPPPDPVENDRSCGPRCAGYCQLAGNGQWAVYTCAREPARTAQ